LLSSQKPEVAAGSGSGIPHPPTAASDDGDKAKAQRIADDVIKTAVEVVAGSDKQQGDGVVGATSGEKPSADRSQSPGVDAVDGTSKETSACSTCSNGVDRKAITETEPESQTAATPTAEAVQPEVEEPSSSVEVASEIPEVAQQQPTKDADPHADGQVAKPETLTMKEAPSSEAAVEVTSDKPEVLAQQQQTEIADQLDGNTVAAVSETVVTSQPEAEEEQPSAEALKEIEKLRSLTRQLREAVDESRKADGLDALDDEGHRRGGHDHCHGHSEVKADAGSKLSKHREETTAIKDEHETVDNTSGVSQARQSRSEKKARKAICKLGLKQVNGIAQVTIRRRKNVMFIISRPDVYVNSSLETYIVFGEARIEDQEERAKQEAAKHFLESSDTTVRNLAKPSPDGAAVEQQLSDDEKIDESGLSEKDIELVMSQAGVTRSRAVRALIRNDNDIVNAIMALTT
jgi:nascent polypeptide-associated complex subunit alpha